MTATTATGTVQSINSKLRASLRCYSTTQGGGRSRGPPDGSRGGEPSGGSGGPGGNLPEAPGPPAGLPAQPQAQQLIMQARDIKSIEGLLQDFSGDCLLQMTLSKK